MRGKAKFVVDTRETSGITPAYAGKRPVLPDSKNDIEDHPRLCGEKFLGSPESPFSQGITPAYAGKRPRFIQIHHICWDHPRLCGEKSIKALCSLSLLGSPPPMRGKGPELLKLEFDTRITPAYAGKR